MADPPVAWGGRAQGDEELPDLASFDAEDQKKIAKIQAVQRGRMARKQAPLKRVETAQGSVVVESTPEELEAAAIKIQARHRGRRARADLAKMKQSSKAKTAREEEVKGVVRLIVTGLMQFPQFQGGVRIADAFAVNDSDRDGSVTETELRNSLVGYGVDVAPHKAALLFEEMDKDADGSVTIIEFSKLLTKYAPEMMALNETSVPEISGMGHRLYTYNDVFKYLQMHGLLVTFNEMIAFIVSMRPTEHFPFLSEHFARVLPGLAADSKHSLFTQLVKSAEVHGGQKLPKGVESNAKDYLDVHLVRGFFEDFVQKLILEDLPHSPLQLLHKQLEWEAKKALT